MGSRPSGEPTSHRTWHEKVHHLAFYDAARKRSAGKDYLRSQGLSAAQLSDWGRELAVELLGVSDTPAEAIGEPFGVGQPNELPGDLLLRQPIISQLMMVDGSVYVPRDRQHLPT